MRKFMSRLRLFWWRLRYAFWAIVTLREALEEELSYWYE